MNYFKRFLKMSPGFLGTHPNQCWTNTLFSKYRL